MEGQCQAQVTVEVLEIPIDSEDLEMLSQPLQPSSISSEQRHHPSLRLCSSSCACALSAHAADPYLHHHVADVADPYRHHKAVIIHAECASPMWCLMTTATLRLCDLLDC